MKKILGIIMAAVCAMSFVACKQEASGGENGGNTVVPEPSPKEEYKYVDYTPEHSAKNRFVNFASSQNGLHDFLNEYAERHMRDNPVTRVGTASVGYSTRAAWREWDSMIGGWWDASNTNGTMSENFATNDAVNTWLELDSAPKDKIKSAVSIVDNQGYVWGEQSANLQNSWGMGWAFPSYKDGGIGWDFGSDKELEDWTVLDSENLETTRAASKLKLSTKNAVSQISIETNKFKLNPAYTPFLRVGFMFDTTVAGVELDDLYVEWTTSDSPQYSSDKCVKFSDFCVNGSSLTQSKVELKDYAFPMYLHKGWGADFESDRLITGLRITLKGKKAFRGTLSFDFIASDYDDRQPLNNCNYILAAKNNLEFSRDAEQLAKVLPNARKAMNFMLNTLGGKEGLISTEYLVGHFNKGMHEIGTGIGNGYWDVDAFPEVNLYCNISYYNALVAMKYLEDMADSMGIAFEEVKTANAAMNGFDTYGAATKANLSNYIAECKKRIQTEFWNEKTGRFHVGFYDDGSNEPQEHGYVMFNEQCITSGIATPEQRKSILSWINGERTVAGDDSTGKDIYYYEFAPRFNTQNIGNDFYWKYSCGWDGNVQNGGTALHVAYYDVVAQAAESTEKAYERVTALQKWFEKIKAAGGEGKDFYRAYYNKTDIPVQGNYNGKDINGLIGVDCEFLEAALLFRAVPDAFFGMSTQADGTLCFAPAMPSSLDWLRIENLVYAGNYYDVSASKYFLQISGVAEYGAVAAQEAQLCVSFPEPNFNYGVYVNGKKTSAYSKKDGVIKAIVPFGNVKVEIKEVK